jgi:hypothetical protein
MKPRMVARIAAFIASRANEEARHCERSEAIQFIETTGLLRR